MSAVIAGAVIAAVGVGVSAHNAAQASNQNERNQRKQRTAAKRQESLQQQQQNRLNRRAPNINALLEANKGAGNSTLLTGQSKAKRTDLSLGRDTLLGG